MSDPEIVGATAKYYRSLYNAFLSEGFSKEQAMQLLTSMSKVRPSMLAKVEGL